MKVSNRMRISACHICLLSVVSLTALSQQEPDSLSVPDPHRHVVPVHQTPWKNDLAPDARFVRITGPVTGRDTVLSPGGHWRAFILDRPDEQGGRAGIQEMQTGFIHEVLGIPLPYRPLADLVWLNDHLLAFDRWSQPHFGVHYVVDVQQLRLVLSVSFPDELMLRQQEAMNDTLSHQH